MDNTKNPAYAGTSIEMRDDNEVFIENRTTEFKAVTVHEKREESNTYYEKLKNRSEKIKKRSV